ncbi:hypothetical protein GPECTOR_26g555 [Gonium pectorale]|uniref:Uncharacterized protein n=1 Tax=Gonium pectorale TaxID=33097 RepID=A0A150GFN5_GONPE|nr:hypothetical protein GPECTOR_26g555 [Gonium pectorale]|eukprot:KXZ48652.1 hypothetical protein GPECTOR_26g555 [Gonium pectorale]
MQSSLFAASPCGTSLVLLSNSGGGGSCASAHPAAVAAAAGLAPGQVLPVPWLTAVTATAATAPVTSSGSGAACTARPSASAVLTAAAVRGAAATAAAAAFVRSDEDLVILGGVTEGAPRGGASEPGVLVWQFPETAPPGSSRAEHVKELSSFPRDWRPLLESIYMDVQTSAAANVTGPLGGASGAVGGGSAAASVKLPQPSLQQLRFTLLPLRLGDATVGALLLAAPAAVLPGLGVAAPPHSAELLAGVAAATAECCLGPHLADIQRVTAAARELSVAVDIQGLASAMSSAVVEALSLELFVDFAVRLAVVPQPSYGADARGTAAQYGFMLTEMTGGGAGAGAAGDGSAPHRGSHHGMTGRAVGRSTSLQQPLAERVLPLSGVSKATSLTSGGGAAAAVAQVWDVTSGGGGGGGHVNSGVHSFNLPVGAAARGPAPAADAGPRVWKARPFSLESTLLWSVLSSARRQKPHLPSPLVRGAEASSYIPSATYDEPLGPASGPGGLYRVRSAAVPHVQAYVNDTDQPSADVMLLFRPGSAAAGGAVTGGGARAGGSASMGLGMILSGAGGGAPGPASLVLVAGNATLCVGESTGSSLSGGDVCVCVALYLTAQERLPSSLLHAARSRAQALMESVGKD